MAEIKLDEEALGHIRVFQNLTVTPVLDCIEFNGRVIFVVAEGGIAEAVGKKGVNVVQFSKTTGKDVLVIEFSSDPATFVRNVFRNYGVRNVDVGDKDGVTHATVTVDPSMKGKAIGREGRNLRMARTIISRHTPIESVVVA